MREGSFRPSSEHRVVVGRRLRQLDAQRTLIGRDKTAEEQTAALDLAPEDDQVAFWTGLTLAGSGRIDEARDLLERARSANPRWAAYLRRMAASGKFPNDPQLLDALFPLEP